MSKNEKLRLIPRRAVAALSAGFCAMLFQVSAQAQAQAPAPPPEPPERVAPPPHHGPDDRQFEHHRQDFQAPPRRMRGPQERGPGGREFGPGRREFGPDGPMHRGGPGPHGMGGPHMPPPPPPPLTFEEVDANGDGSITREEFDSAIPRDRERHERMHAPGHHGQDRSPDAHGKAECDKPDTGEAPAPPEKELPEDQR